MENEKEFFMDLPKGIYSERMVWFGAWKEYREVSEKVKVIEEKLALEILKQIDENGKKLYPNEALRKEAVQLRLNQMPEHANLKKRCEVLEVEMAGSQIRSDYLKNKFDMLKVVGV
jgi:hypothetical protein